jgi:hypothetical protein
LGGNVQESANSKKPFGSPPTPDWQIVLLCVLILVLVLVL